MIRRPPRSTLFPYTTLSDLPVLQTPKATSSTLYFDSLTVNAGNGGFLQTIDRKSGSAGMPRPISYAVFCLKKKKKQERKEETDSAKETKCKCSKKANMIPV